MLISIKAARTIAEFVMAGQKAEGVTFAAVADLVLTVLLFTDYLLGHVYER